MATSVFASTAPARSYPVLLDLVPPISSSRLWAIPLLGIGIKSIITIPHAIYLYVLSLVVGATQLIVWIPVLFTGRYPEWAFGLNVGTLRLSSRLFAYLLGLTDVYPSFSMEKVNEGDLDIERPETSSRLWAIPFLGIFIKSTILIPHAIVLYALYIALGISHLVLWIPVLFTGRYPGWGFSFTVGTIRWTERVYAYVYGLTDKYPPFSMSS